MDLAEHHRRLHGPAEPLPWLKIAWVVFAVWILFVAYLGLLSRNL